MLQKSQKALKCVTYQQLLACLFDSNSYSYRHTNHGVVAGTDETHHFFAVDALGELQSGETF